MLEGKSQGKKQMETGDSPYRSVASIGTQKEFCTKSRGYKPLLQEITLLGGWHEVEVKTFVINDGAYEFG